MKIINNIYGGGCMDGGWSVDCGWWMVDGGGCMVEGVWMEGRWWMVEGGVDAIYS
ncbi:hypothetical protein DFA_01533 [Cavenderia fasciculata]|uniref:Uncharacterized protein n=1 Tax=Cavenderia fasciculata TaxID=261658 RepID=F4PTC5_CACFS|nr:uncharacterized protein DFA_01533 [Cavenderia fasciculata]EGG21647.1 hypothetical protein DFA_01533 [Cavenderia fasciculata]|eukprot:XP_004359497.1 hypothetical protein DFA_01533 [Cavenderia fasciculata]